MEYIYYTYYKYLHINIEIAPELSVPPKDLPKYFFDTFTFTKYHVFNGRIDHVNIGNKSAVNCTNLGLVELPDWPNVKYVYCSYNKLTKLPNWKNVEEVQCYYNQLTELPDWQNIKYVHCSNNQLTKLPNWQNIKRVFCSNNQLTELPDWQNNVYIHNREEIKIKSLELNEKTALINNCFCCSLNDIKVYKCRTCTFLICKKCFTDWNKIKCMLCNNNFI